MNFQGAEAQRELQRVKQAHAEHLEQQRAEAELARKVRERTEAKRAMKAMQEREAADAEASRQVAKRTGVMAGEIRLKP